MTWVLQRDDPIDGLLTGNFQWSRALVSGDLDGDVGRVVDLAVLDDQLPLLPLGHNLDPG